MANARGIRAGQAFVELFADDSKLVRGLKNAQKKLKAFGMGIAGMGTKVAAVGAGIITPLLAATKVFMDMGSEMDDMSQRTGIGVEALSELAYAAQMSGADMGTFENGIRGMQKSIGDAGRGLSKPIAALQRLGLSYEQVKDLSPEDQFSLIADRLSGMADPTLKAATAMDLFGTAGQQLIPMMADGAEGIEAMRKNARDLGLSMSKEDVAASAKLGDAFDTLWMVLKMVAFTIGSALAPIMQTLVVRMTTMVASAINWIKQNKQLVVTVLKVGAAVVAAGVALVALGGVIVGVGVVLGSLGTILAAASAAFGVLISIIGAILSPIGLAIAAVAALGAYLVYATGAGGKALAWLGDRFNDLAGFARESFGGISDALAAGDIALAAKILWLSLKVAWKKGVEVLTGLWEGLKATSIKIVYDMWYGLQAAFEISVAAVTKVMLKLYYGILGFWNRLSTGIRNIWGSVISWVAKRMVDVWGKIDKTLDTEAIKKALDEDNQQQQGARNDEEKKERAKIDADRDAALKMADKEHAGNMAGIGQASIDANKGVDDAAQAKIDTAQADLDKARQEWRDAIGKAKTERKAKDIKGPDALKAPPKIDDYLKGAGAAVNEAKLSVRGTFNAAAIQSLAGGGNADERTAKATEATEKLMKKLIQIVDVTGFAFG